MQNKVFIKEIFESIQGEGPFIGINQLFIRFSKCNLNCKYCDTDFKTNLKLYSDKELLDEINKYPYVHSISLTGGEPLCETDFLLEFLPLINKNKKIYLETNGILYENLQKLINNIDIISMDIKLPSSCEMIDMFDIHRFFIEISVKHKKEIFLKTVFDEKITDDEIKKTILLAQKYDLLIILQPKTEDGTIRLSQDFIYNIYYKFIKNYRNVRLIPQVHKFLKIR
ncbi:MAG: 7-carboxy-7-deazaguanine synthase QueE [Candidatus Gastranaerophilales bacterium]|nr:7-carboxy-7-deazaguanine synthase QueE [Candidatus Gastranaerophilales bacterium]